MSCLIFEKNLQQDGFVSDNLIIQRKKNKYYLNTNNSHFATSSPQTKKCLGHSRCSSKSKEIKK